MAERKRYVFFWASWIGHRGCGAQTGASSADIAAAVQEAARIAHADREGRDVVIVDTSKPASAPVPGEPVYRVTVKRL